MDSSLPRPAPPRSLVERLREWVVWFGPARLAATALAVIAVAIGGTWLLKGSPSRAEDQLPFATHSTAIAIAPSANRQATTTTTAAPSVVVYVAGAVAAPGVYTLARVVAGHRCDVGGGRCPCDSRPQRGQPRGSRARRRADLRAGRRRDRAGRGRAAPAVGEHGSGRPGQHQHRNRRSTRRAARRRSHDRCGNRRPPRTARTVSDASINSAMSTASARPNSRRCAGW